MNIPEAAHFELINWSRFCWEGAYPYPLPATHCFSFEHHYQAPSDLGDKDAPPPRIVANAHRALIVQGVYQILPINSRLVLRAEYPQRRASGRAEYGMVGAARRLHIRLSEYEYALQRAVDKVQEAFA